MNSDKYAKKSGNLYHFKDFRDILLNQATGSFHHQYDHRCHNKTQNDKGLRNRFQNDD
jgi:hypothetical protein